MCFCKLFLVTYANHYVVNIVWVFILFDTLPVVKIFDNSVEIQLKGSQWLEKYIFFSFTVPIS